MSMKKTYKTKSVIIGRKKKVDDSLTRPCFISMFSVNNPHKTGDVPDKIVDMMAYSVIFHGLNLKYMLHRRHT